MLSQTQPLETRNYSDSSKALAKVVASGKRAFKLEFPGVEFAFEAPFWYVAHMRDRSVTSSNPRLYFTRSGTTNQPLPKRFSQVIKSWLLQEYRIGARSAVPPLEAARILWEAILTRRGNQVDRFDWGNICDEDMNQAELLMRERWNQSTTYKGTGHLLSLGRFASRKAISRPSYYVPHTPRIEDSNRHTIAGREARKAKLPTAASLHGLAKIYRLASDPSDQILSAAIAITAAAGFRVGELLTLPYDCQIEEQRAGRPRYGLRYYKEKNREDEKLFAVRWLTPIQAELARDAIARIRSITEPARQRAQVLEDNPHRVPISLDLATERLTAEDVANQIGVKASVEVHAISVEKLKRYKDKGRIFFHVSDVEAYLLSRRVRRLWTVNRKNGSRQMLSETLLIAPKNTFHSAKATCSLLIEPLNVQHISNFLGGKRESKSAFERFDITESDGRFCRMNSHQLRYWVNDIADKGGLPVDTLTRWMGRENPRDTEAYRFETADEKCNRIKEGIRSGEIRGHLSELYFSLPEEERDIFLDSQVQSVHFTPMGICAHDYSLSPCDRHLNCVRGTCPDYLRTKGNQTERNNLIQLVRNTESSLKCAEVEAQANNGNLAPAWVKHYQDTIAGAKAALAVDDDLEIEDGAMIRPFQSK
jgi:hypothetical protein